LSGFDIFWRSQQIFYYSTMSQATRIRPMVFNLLRADRQTDTQSKGNRSMLSAFRCESEKSVN